MILYDCRSAPSPRRARMFLAEKGVRVVSIQVDLSAGEHLTPAFRKINPRCTVPVLKTDDGEVITDNAGIARYVEEAFDGPLLMGSTPLERARVAELNAHVEYEGLMAVADAFRNSAKGLRGRAMVGQRSYEQIPELASRGQQRASDFFVAMNQLLCDREFMVGDHFSIADISLVVGVDFATWIKMKIPKELAHLRDWHGRMQQRPSYRA